MSAIETLIVGIALATSFIIAIARAIQDRNVSPALFTGVLLVAVIVALRWGFGFPTPLVSRGESNAATIVVLFVFMLAGMMAQSLQGRFELPREKRPPFDIGAFILPFLRAPIVFIPLLAALQNAQVDTTRLTVPGAMLLAVAFENGFFWKHYADSRQRQRRQASSR